MRKTIKLKLILLGIHLKKIGDALKIYVYVQQSYLQDGVINDPLGQTHNHAISDHWYHLKIVLFCAILKRRMCENSNHYQLWLWLGLADHWLSKEFWWNNSFCLKSIVLITVINQREISYSLYITYMQRPISDEYFLFVLSKNL